MRTHTYAHTHTRIRIHIRIDIHLHMSVCTYLGGWLPRAIGRLDANLRRRLSIFVSAGPAQGSCRLGCKARVPRYAYTKHLHLHTATCTYIQRESIYIEIHVRTTHTYVPMRIYALGSRATTPPPPVGGLNRVYLEADTRVFCCSPVLSHEGRLADTNELEYVLEQHSVVQKL